MNSAQTAAQPAADNPLSSPLLSHPTVVYVKDRLRDPTETTQLRTVHAFDFDSTLFRSPLPNPALWDPSFVGRMVSWNTCGSGWWHNPSTLDLGPEAEASAWDGWWNEDLLSDVEKSAKDPTCLTVLLTGRNGPVYSDQLVRMVQAKGLDFDLIAMKPISAVRLETTQKKEVYQKIHTFSVKHDFLYNVLLDFPSIRHMHVWDDRIGQIIKFQKAGKEWLHREMLDTFEISEVKISLRYMDPEREKKLVLAMVEAHNQQAKIEAKGGSFLVYGVGPMPYTRPELKDCGIWSPYETYVPQKRARMEMVTIPQYTGVMFSKEVQSFLNQYARGDQSGTGLIKTPPSLSGQDLSSWEVPDDLHVTLSLGSAHQEYLETIGGLGATVLVEIEAAGELEGKIWAVKVKGVDSLEDSDDQTIIAPNGLSYPTFRSLFGTEHNQGGLGSTTHSSIRMGRLELRKTGTLHITMAYDRLQGARASTATKIAEWIGVRNDKETNRVILVGKIGEKRLLGIKPQHLGHLATVPRAEVSIANIIKQRMSEREIPISGRQLGMMIKEIQDEMERLSIENKTANTEKIMTLSHAVCDRALN
ncbi:hypothetical protein EDD21DRAFT_444904 [Dissophora ornata]|nr:hypothetical protein BGZ58_010999 [Dissophora ornata]KAI8599991.1 hypothetical protein EDD21DRAFT_444904 [Dissophora ornata]